MHCVQGGCHCGNIIYEAKLSHTPSSYVPRACDCDFCTRHAASYISDPEGALSITIHNEQEVSYYKQGSQLASFLICKRCGVMIGAFYVDNGLVYASLNSRSADAPSVFDTSQAAHLLQLTDMQRIERWKTIWFSSVQMTPRQPPS